MKKHLIKKWVGLFFTLLFLLSILTPLPTLAEGNTKVIEPPNLHIDGKGKISVADEEGNVESKESVVKRFLDRYRYVVAGISGVGTVSMILFFILGFIRLGSVTDNPEERSNTIRGLFLTGVATACLGAVTLITGIFYNAL